MSDTDTPDVPVEDPQVDDAPTPEPEVEEDELL